MVKVNQNSVFKQTLAVREDIKNLKPRSRQSLTPFCAMRPNILPDRREEFALTIAVTSFFCPSTPLRMTKKDKTESVLKRPKNS